MIQSISYSDDPNKEPVTFKFASLTVEQEEEWADWVREQHMLEASRDCAKLPPTLQGKFLAEISLMASLDECRFEGIVGLKKVGTKSGMVKILEMASRTHHNSPGIPESVLKKMISDKEAECSRIVISVIPISQAHQQIIFGEMDKREKKANGAMAGRSYPPTTSEGT